MKKRTKSSAPQSELECGKVHLREAMVSGVPASINCVEVGNQIFSISGGWLRTVGLEDEWYDDVSDPASIISALEETNNVRADLFTFWQRPPAEEPAFDYWHDFDELALLPISSYEDWWKGTIKSRVRTSIRKAAKRGVEVREVEYNDAFIEGMVGIFNESRIRQGRAFWHYGKDFETVKQQFSRYVHRERMIGAYFRGEMIGFVMLGNAGSFSLLGQILSSARHRDKATNSVLVAKSVELAAEYGHEHLAYWYWTNDSLTEFKRRCGFQRVRVPRYYVPLSLKGRIALEAGLHKGVRQRMPEPVRHSLRKLRSRWYSFRDSGAANPGSRAQG